MAKDRPPEDTNRSALERYLAKQKQDRAAKSPLAEKPAAAASGKKSFFKHTDDPMSIQRPEGFGPQPVRPSVSQPIRQPSDLGRWEKVAAEKVNEGPQPISGTISEMTSESERRAIESGAPAMPPPIERPEPLAHGKPGDFGSRFMATLIDWAILGAFGYPVRRAINSALAVVFGPIVELHTDGLDVIVSGLMIYAYYGYFYSRKGASPGKLLLGLEVVNADSGGRLTPINAFFREAIGKFISTIPFMMGYFIVLFRDDRRALHDLLFDTRVVSKKT